MWVTTVWRGQSVGPLADATVVGQKFLDQVKGGPQRQDTGLGGHERMQAQGPKNGANVFLKMLKRPPK